ncbi:hypothetical protein AX15_000460 [Amanita polypyramis BW_CC]|nr:hypothetical protein AX15_000460 [Amanita polypyramis BW_CC]
MSSDSQTTTDTRWIPLESNPDVFNLWAEKAGLVTSQACFHDVYGLDEELLALVPKPVKAVILLFPLDSETKAEREAEDEVLAKESQPLLDKTILWIKQTIGNACGTMALLHALANTDVTITPESPLAQFIDQCKDKTPLERAQHLETTPLFGKIHAEMATTGGQTAVPTNLDTDLHFTCFVAAPSQAERDAATETAAISSGVDPDESGEKVKSSMRLIELDGGRRGPVDRGECKVLMEDVAQIVKATYFTRNDTMLFSLMALAPPES